MARVSIIIPAYNRAGFLGEAIHSVLAQTFTDFEVIVVDDGSTDNTSDVVRTFADPRVEYIRQNNQGPAGARNAGIRASTGECVTFLDSDDTLLPRKLEIQARALDAHHELGLVASGYEFIDEGGRLLREERPWIGRASPDLPSILLGGLAPVHAVMVRRAWLDQVGGFDVRFRAAEDMDLWYRLSLAGCGMGWVPAIVCRYRIHRHNMCRSIRNHFQAFYAVLDKLFASPNLPEEIGRHRNEIYAGKMLAEAGELYGVDDLEDGKEALETALRIDHNLLDGDAAELIAQMVAWEDSIWADNRSGLLDQVLRDLPTDLAELPGFGHRLELTRDEARFYRAFRNADKQRVRQLWMTVARHEPTWLLNRGTWSILLQSMRLVPMRNGKAQSPGRYGGNPPRLTS